MKLKLSISTCPNDTFMFDAMLHRRIDTEGLDFDLTMADIEQLNAAALAGEPDITKLSYASFPLVADRYRILGSGSALGRGNGPLLVSRHKLYPDELRDAASRSRASTRPRTGCCRCFSPKRPTNGLPVLRYRRRRSERRMRRRRTDPRRPIHVPREGIAARSRSGRGVGETHFAAVAARSHRRFAPTGRATGPDGRARTAPQRGIRLCSSRSIGRLRAQPCPRTERGGDEKPYRAVREPPFGRSGRGRPPSRRAAAGTRKRGGIPMIRETLERLRAEDNLRELPRIEIRGKYVVCDGKRYLNLSSNDYLGLACSDADRKFMQRQPDDGAFLLSNPSSRLVTGQQVPTMRDSSRPCRNSSAAARRWSRDRAIWSTRASCRL